MQAFILDRYGKGQSLRLGDMSDPVPAADEVLIDVQAAALNQLDGAQARVQV